MANDDNKWYFSKERLENSPSRRCGIEKYKELSYRQRAANFIQDLGQKLKVNQLCVNTAIVYMHRFYVFHSFTHFPWASIASASVFLAAKVEEQPQKLEHVIQYANLCNNRHDTRLEMNSRRYQAQAQDLVFNENVLLQTLGFDVVIHHPHTHAIKRSQLIIATKDLAQTSYFMASYSLHLTTMCLQYKPKVIACFCIHLACKRLNYEFLLSRDNRGWFTSVDSTVTANLLNQLTEEYLPIFEKCPPRLKEKVMEMGRCFPFESEKKLAITSDTKDHRQHQDNSKPGSTDISHKPHKDSTPSSSSQPAYDGVYKKREVESRAWHVWSKPIASNPASKEGVPHGHGIKKHLSCVGAYDKTSASSVLNHSMKTIWHKMESPLTIPAGISKSVPKINSSLFTVDLLCDPSIRIEVTHPVPVIITPISDTSSDQLEEIYKEMKPPHLVSPFANDALSRQPPQPIMKSVETNATLISNLLKDTHTVSHLPSMASSAKTVAVKGQEEKNHHHHKENKHKHKGKDRSKKKKHKDKDHRGKDKDQTRGKVKQPGSAPLPIKDTISKDKIQLDPVVISGGHQINIWRDRLKADAPSNEPSPIAPLKIKIPKDVINNYIGQSRKRNGDKTSPRGTPPAKMSKSSHHRSSDSKQNGRNSYKNLCCSNI